MTFQERFTEACKTQKFKPYELIQGPDAGYTVWEVQHVSGGQQVTVDGPFFTEEEARVSADLLRGAFRGARASETIYNRVWNYDPRQEQLTIDQAHMSRAVLAIRLGASSPFHQSIGGPMAATAIEYAPLTTIKLYGQLRQFGKSYQFSVRTPAEAIKALSVQIPGFERFLSNSKSRGLVFAIFRGKKNIGEGELGFQGKGDIIIAPVIVGSKRSGALQTVIGAVLIAASFFTFWAPPVSAGLFASGVGMVVGGVIQMLSPQAGGLKTSAAPENTPGYAFGSAKNTTASGNPVPLCIGERRWGGAIISAAIYAEDKM